MSLENEKDLLGVELAKDLEAKRKVEEAEKKASDARKKIEDDKKKKTVIILKNTLGEEVSPSDYFYSKSGNGIAPLFFTESYGLPVEREELVAVFNKIFNPKHGVLFYKARDKEVYIIIVPLKHSSTVGLANDSVDGEFQKHAISFISEGSVNLDTLRNKLTRVAGNIRISTE